MHDDTAGRTDGIIWPLDDDTPMLSNPFKEKGEPAPFLGKAGAGKTFGMNTLHTHHTTYGTG